MTGPRLSSLGLPSSYWQVSRAPRYSLLFALPLLVFYDSGNTASPLRRYSMLAQK